MERHQDVQATVNLIEMQEEINIGFCGDNVDDNSGIICLWCYGDLMHGMGEGGFGPFLLWWDHFLLPPLAPWASGTDHPCYCQSDSVGPGGAATGRSGVPQKPDLKALKFEAHGGTVKPLKSLRFIKQCRQLNDCSNTDHHPSIRPFISCSAIKLILSDYSHPITEVNFMTPSGHQRSFNQSNNWIRLKKKRSGGVNVSNNLSEPP